MAASAKKAQFLKSTAIVSLGGAFAGMILLCLFFASEISRLAQENQRLVSEKASLDRRVSNIEDSFRDINHYSDTLDELTLATVAGETDEKGRMTAIRSALQRVRHYSSPEEARLNIVNRTDDIVADTSRLSQTLRNLVSILEHRREILDATPTLTPATGWISSFYGERHSPFSGKEVVHRGIDIGAESGTPVYAPADGVVDLVGKSASFGNFLVIKHPYGIMTKYAHNQEVKVKKGESIKRGQEIALVGSTGRSTGPHLHYEVWVGKKPVDPRNFLLDQKLKVINLTAMDSIGGEEFAVEKKSNKSNLEQAQSAKVERMSAREPIHAEGIGFKKSIGIMLLMIALGLLGYLVLVVVRDQQDKSLFNVE